jgi:hypothetical protein
MEKAGGGGGEAGDDAHNRENPVEKGQKRPGN